MFKLLFGLNEEALSEFHHDYDSLLGASIALQNLGRFEEAFQKINEAINMEQARFEGYYRRAQLSFIHGKIQQAMSDTESSLSLRADHRDSQLLKKKCELELKNQKLEQSNEEKKIQTLQRNDIYSQSGKLMYKWYQTDSKVGIEIHHALPNKDDLKCLFEPKKLQLSFPIDGGKSFQLELDLFSEIVVEQSKTKVGLTVIEVILEKKERKLNWPKLEAGVEHLKMPEQATYPSSNPKKKDWDKIDKEIEDDIKKNKEEYGEDPLSTLFKQIYANGDENTRRAMVKSMQTSNGTVLSTNWDEVRTKDYKQKDRPSPPKGQEYKKWG